MTSKRLVIVDGYSLLYRAFFATRFLSTSDGRPTNALYGFTQMLFGILESVKPDAIVVALDAPGKNFRHADFAEYKGTRKETAPELKAQFPMTRELLADLGIPQVEVTGFEADDVVGTISKLAEENGYETTIVTGDLDSLQLVDECVSVLTPRTGVTDTITYDPAAVRARYGFGPEHIVDMKALKGDTSDNIPGVPGIGDKGAAELIAEFGEVENLLSRSSAVPAKYWKKIEPFQDQMLLCKKLATIRRDVPLEYDFQPFQLTEAQIEAARGMLEGLEMKSLARRAPVVLGRYRAGFVQDDASDAAAQELAEPLKFNHQANVDLGMIGEAIKAGPCAFLFPSSGLLEGEPRGYVARGAEVWSADADGVRALLAESAGSAILHDSKRIFKSLPKLPKVAASFDTMLAAYVLQSGRSTYELGDLVQAYLELTPPTDPAEMTAAIFALRDSLAERLEKEGQSRVLFEIEQPLVPILAEMERLGIAAQREGLKEFSASLESEIAITAARIFELAGQEFTIGSPKQLGEVLFEKLGLPGAQKTKTGYATGAEVLQTMPDEISQKVLYWRELTKLKSTYADALEKLIADDGRIHTTYAQTVAATGRLSSNDPNLQNIPIRTELGRGIRKAFVAAPGYELASFDYSQIELRILAHYCNEPALVDAFRHGIDVHSVTAQQMFGLPATEITKEQRRYAKMLNYAVLYGVTDFGLANQLGGDFSRSEARDLIQTYNERFPSVKEYTRAVVQEARSKGFTTTIYGRRRYFPDIHAARIQERQYAERQAMNAPLQGSAADLIKLAMIHVRKAIEGTGVRMLLNVHDELVFEMPVGDRSMVETIRSLMENAIPMNVPIEVDAKIGPNWNEMLPIERVAG